MSVLMAALLVLLPSDTMNSITIIRQNEEDAYDHEGGISC
jgi:hypothetical protein